MRPLDPRLLRRASGVRNLLVVAVVLAPLSAAAVIAQALLLAGILADVIIGGLGPADVAGRLLWLGGVIALRAALAWISEELARRTAGSVTAGLRRDLLRHAALLGPRWRSGQHSGELATLATTGVESLHDYVARYVPQLVLSVLIPLVMLGYVITSDLTSGLIIAVTLPLIPLFMALVGWYTDRQTRAKWHSLARLSGHFADVVAGLPTLKVFGRAKAQAESVRRVTEDYRRTSMVTLRVAFLSSMVLELLASLSVALVAVVIGFRLVYGDLTLEVGLAVLILAPEAYLPLRQLGTQFHAAADGVAASAKVLDVLDTPAPVAGTRRDIPASVGLAFDAVAVGEPGERGAVGPWSLRFPAGRVTVVQGPSGVGKTTLLQMLSGVLRPDAGRVLVVPEPGPSVGVGNAAPIDLAAIDAQAWRDRIAWCGQGAWLRAGSVRDNLALGNPEADDAVLRIALEAADAADFVDAMSDGWSTVLGEGGAGLSQGQQQRLALARALARPAQLILLDEPTAALDPHTEERVLNGIRRLAADRTVVLVTHRPAPLRIADQVVTLTGSDRATAAETTTGIAALSGVGPW